MAYNAETCCYEYINAIKDIEKFSGFGIYNLDKQRTEIHNELCTLFGLSKEQTKKYTDNIDLESDSAGADLYFNLLEESRTETLHE